MRFIITFCIIVLLQSVGVKKCLSQNNQRISLLSAIRQNDSQAVYQLVNNGANVNETDSNNASALMWAAYVGNLSVFKLLISHGADHTTKGVIYLDTVKQDYYGNITSIAAGDNDTTLLKYCLDSLYLNCNDREFNPKSGKNNGWYPLQWAAYNGRVESLSILLARGASLNCKDLLEGSTPVLLAAQNRKYDAVDFLLQQDSIDVKASDNEGWQLIHFISRDLNSVGWIIELSNKGADVNAKNALGLTPLLLSAIYGNSSSALGLLVSHADVTMHDSTGNTALALAARRGDQIIPIYIKRCGEGVCSWKSMKPLYDSLVLLESIHEFADSCKSAGSTIEAIEYYKKESTFCARIFGTGSKFYVNALNNAADLLLAQRNNAIRLVLPEGHLAEITDFNYSHDGRFLVSASEDRKAMIWEARNGKLVHILQGHTGTVTSARFSPDGSKVITTAVDANPILWNAITGEQLRKLPAQSLVNFYTNAQFSNNGKQVLLPTINWIGKLYDVSTGTVIKTLEDSNFRAEVSIFENAWRFKSNFAGFTHNNKFIITSNNSNTIRIWDATSFNLIRTLTGHNGIISNMSISEDDQYLLTTSFDSSARLWSIQTGTMLVDFHLPGGSIIDATMSPDAQTLVFSTSDSNLVFYHLQAGKVYRTAKCRNGIATRLIFSADGELLATKNGTNFTSIWSTRRANIIADRKFDYTINAIKFSPDTRVLSVAVNTDIYMLSSFDLSTSNILTTAIFPTKLLAVNPTATHFITTSYSSDHALRGWDITKAAISEDILQNKKLINEGAYSPDGKIAATCSFDSTVNIYNTGSWSLIRMLKFEDAASSLKFSATGKYMAVGFMNGDVVLLHAETMKELLHISDSEKIVKMVFCRHDSILIYGTSKGSFHVIDIFAGKKLYNTTVQQSHQKFNLVSIDVSKDSNQVLLCYDGRGEVVDIRTFEVIHKLNDDYVPPIVAVKFSDSSGNILYLLANDKIIEMNLISHNSKVLTNVSRDSSVTVETYHRNGEVEEAIIITPDRRYILALNDSLIIYDKLHSKVILKVKAIDFKLSENGKVLLYNTGSSFVAYSLIYTEEIATFISMNQFDQGYVSLTKEGYYRGNRSCINQLSYADNNTLFSFNQFDIQFNRPDKVLLKMKKYFGTSGEEELINAYAKSYYKRIARLKITPRDETNEKIIYPICEVINENELSSVQDSFSVKIRIRAFDTSGSLSKFNVIINDVPVYGSKGILVPRQFSKLYDTIIELQLIEGANSIEPFVQNNQGYQSAIKPIRIFVSGMGFHYFDKYSDSLGLNPLDMKITIEPKTYFIGIGISNFADKRYDLNYGVKDIRELAVELKKKIPEIQIDTLFDKLVTKANVNNLKRKLLQLNEFDHVIISYAGHGMLDSKLDYYISTYNMDFKHPEKNGVAYEELENLLDSIKPRQKLLMIDACQSGDVDKDVEGAENKIGKQNTLELMQALFISSGSETGSTVIAATTGKQPAYERGEVGHGVFSYVLLEALNQYPSLSVDGLKRYVIQHVRALTYGLQKPTIRSETVNRNWQIW